MSFKQDKLTLNRHFMAIFLFLTLTGCQPPGLVKANSPLPSSQTEAPTHTAYKSLQHAYDFQIMTLPTLTPISVQKLAKQLIHFDVIFIGEYHSNHASHLLEAQLFSALHQQHQNMSLSLEMFNRDQQTILDQYLDSEIGETYLINEAPAWQNYIGAYRPLIEYAKQNFIAVIAANASADIVRCIGRQGSAYITKLPIAERAHIASAPFTDNTQYRQRYMAFLKKMKTFSLERKEKSYLAQLTRDNTMAESIYQAWLNDPKQQIVHINGSFHSEQYLGTVAALKTLAPRLKVAVISPVRTTHPDHQNQIEHDLKQLTNEQLTSGDFLYFVQGQPKPFQNMAYQQRSRKTLFSQADKALCY